MTEADRQVRVFISSTFRDMHAERDHLVTVVFPELRERVEQLGLEFFDVDLRWGVPEKMVDGETANSWEYCRQWIDRVEPFFVCILGQRYGWVPNVRDFKSAADQARQAAEPRSITDLEVRHAVLDNCRKRRSLFYDLTVRIWDVKCGKAVGCWTCEGRPHVAVPADGRHLAIVDEVGRTYLVDATDKN